MKMIEVYAQAVTRSRALCAKKSLKTSGFYPGLGLMSTALFVVIRSVGILRFVECQEGLHFATRVVVAFERSIDLSEPVVGARVLRIEANSFQQVFGGLLWLPQLGQDFPECDLRINQSGLQLRRSRIMLRGRLPIRSQEGDLTQFKFRVRVIRVLHQGGRELLLRANPRIFIDFIAQEGFSQFEVHTRQSRVDRQRLLVLRDRADKITIAGMGFRKNLMQTC
jgi:hypothetical protein